MTLSKRQLLILADHLQNIRPQSKNEFIGDSTFEDMLCLAMDIDNISSHELFQRIYEDIDETMGLPILADTIAKHIKHF